jgi:hypothetical protein
VTTISLIVLSRCASLHSSLAKRALRCSATYRWREGQSQRQASIQRGRGSGLCSTSSAVRMCPDLVRATSSIMSCRTARFASAPSPSQTPLP